MMEKTVIIVNDKGLHIRPAQKIAELCNSFSSDILIENGGIKANSKSLLGLIGLNAPKGTVMRIVTNGPDEREALEAIVSLIQGGFGGEFDD